jgi:hypothetical protein
MWSTTEFDNTLINLDAMGSFILEEQEDGCKIFAVSPEGNCCHLLLWDQDKQHVKRTYNKIKNVLMQAAPVRICNQTDW